MPNHCIFSKIGQSSRYKFKSNIRERFISLQDESPRQRWNSVSSEPDADDSVGGRSATAAANEVRTESLIQENLAHPKILGSPPPPQISPYAAAEAMAAAAGRLDPLVKVKTEEAVATSQVPTLFGRQEQTSSSLLSLSTGSNRPAATAPPPPPPLPVPVPIFALNSQGSYYVPMTVDLSVIEPFLSLYKEKNCAVLHPVTISVNFQVQIFKTCFRAGSGVEGAKMKEGMGIDQA